MGGWHEGAGRDDGADGARPVPPAARAIAKSAPLTPVPVTVEAAHRAPASRSPASRPVSRPPAPRSSGHAFHYASTRCVPLGQIAGRLGGPVPPSLTSEARRIPVIGIKITSVTGASVHVPPTLTEGGLYLDHRDLTALEAGAVVPELDEIVARIR